MITNRVEKVLIAGNQAADATGIADVSNGEIVVLNRAGAVVAPGGLAALITSNEEINIVLGLAGSERLATGYFPAGDIKKVTNENYRAEVQQQATITFTTPVADTQYIVSIVDKSDKEILQCRQAVKRYEYIAVTGDTATTLAAAIAAKINADPYAVVTATPAAGVVTLTAKASISSRRYKTGEFENQVYFEVFSAADGSLLPQASVYYHQVEFGTVAYTVAPEFGNGTFKQVYKLERGNQPYLGSDNFIGFPADTGLYRASEAATYDILTIEFNNVHFTNSYTQGDTSVGFQSIIIPIEVVTPGPNPMKTYLNGVFLVNPPASPIEISET